jgi:hypothetical protein
MTKSSTPTKADLYQMLAEAVRNTQPRPANPQPEPPLDVKRARPRKIQPAPKPAAKIKSNRGSVGKRRR